MLLLNSPLHDFSSTFFLQGQIHLKLEMPWPLPWSIGALRAVIAWEVAIACEQYQVLVPHLTREMLNSQPNWEFEINNNQWLDGNFSRNADRILARIAEDVLRVQPRPMVEIVGPILDTESLEALSELGTYLNIVISCTSKPLPDTATPEDRAALCLLGSAGLVNAQLSQLLIESANVTGNIELAAALSDLVEGGWNEVRVFSAYDVLPDYKYLAPVLATLGQITWPKLIPDWQGLNLPHLLKDLWTNPRKTLDYLRSDSARQGKTKRNEFHILINIARHFLKCFLEENGLKIRLDLLDASIALRNNQPMRTRQLLSPYTDNPDLLQDVALAAHIYGHAGQAAARLDYPKDALALYEQNLACLEQAFGVGTKQYQNALAGLHHKIGQLLREHPELPGGFVKARHHLEQSLELHKILNRSSGVSMCLNELGKLLMEEGKFKEAGLCLQKALEFDREKQNSSGEARILHDLAILHERTGEFNQALDYVEQCDHIQQSTGIGGNLRQRLMNTRERLRDILGFENENDLEAPADILNKISSDEPRSFCTHVSQKSRTLRQQSRYAEAEALILEGLKRPIPEAPRQFLLLALANLLLDLRRHDAVREILQNIVPRSDRTKDELMLLKARLESQTENYEQAEILISGINGSTQPEILGRVHFTRGQMLFAQNRYLEAVVEFRKAREQGKTSIYAIHLAMEKEARANLMAGEYEQALILAKELVGIQATGKWKLRQIRGGMILGESLLRLGHAIKAAEEFDNAIALAQENSNSNLFPMVALQRRAAQAWAIAGNSNAALVRIQKAQELSELTDSPLEQRGWVYHLAAYLHRANGSSAEYESALHIAEQCAQSSDSKLLLQSVAALRQGDWRQDDWLMDDFDWEENDTPKTAIGHARRLRARLKLDEALKTLAPFEQSLMTEPIRREILELKLGILLDLYERGRTVDLQEALAPLIAGRPDDELSPKFLLLRARAEILERKYEIAIETGMKAYKKGGAMGEFFSIARAASLISKALSEIGRPSEAIAILQQTADYMTAEGRHQFAFDAKYSLCRHFINRRKFNKARQYIQELSDQSPQINLTDWARLQIAHAEIERIEGRSEEAVSRLNEVLARVEGEGRPELREEAARLRHAILLDSGQTRLVLMSPLESGSGRLPATKRGSALIKSLQQSGRHQEAINLAEQLLEKEGSTISRTRAIVLHQAAKSYFKGKKLERAEALCRESLDLHIHLGMDNGTSGVRVTLADILVITGRSEEAKEQLLVALKENQNVSDERGIQICQRRLMQFSGQISSIGRASSSRDLLSRAQTLRREGQFAEALKMITEALRQARSEQDTWAEAQALGGLGINSFKAKDYRQAEKYFKQAVELHSRLGSSSLEECLRYLDRTYKKLKQTTKYRVP